MRDSLYFAEENEAEVPALQQAYHLHCASLRRHFLFASERLPCGERVHVISPANNPPILDGNDGHESVVIRSARFDGLAMNLIFQSDHTAFLVMVNRKSITFFKHDVVAVTRVGGNQVFSPANHPGPTGEPIQELELGIVGDSVVIVVTLNQALQSFHHDIKKWLQRFVFPISICSHRPTVLGVINQGQNVPTRDRIPERISPVSCQLLLVSSHT
jgi:hypothetical protein